MRILKEGIKEYARVFRCECKICNTQVEIIWGDPDILGFSRCVDTDAGVYRHRIKWACPICECENVEENRSGELRMLNHSQRSVRTDYISKWYMTTHVNTDCVEQEDMPDGFDVSWYNEDGTRKVTEEELGDNCW